MNMANVASGGFDAYYEYGLHAWDMAAGDLLIREAGGVVIDVTGKVKIPNVQCSFVLNWELNFGFVESFSSCLIFSIFLVRFTSFV